MCGFCREKDKQTGQEQIIKTWRLDQLGCLQRCRMKGELRTFAQMDSRKLPGTDRKEEGVCRSSGKKRRNEDDLFQLVVGKRKRKTKKPECGDWCLRRQLLMRKCSWVDKPNSKGKAL